MSSDLASQHCVPCRGGVPPMTREEFEPLLAQLEGWSVEEGRKLVKTLRFPDWATAQAFVMAAGEIAEAEGHHPDLTLSWGRVRTEILTHKIGGLTESDFILAAKYDRLYRERFDRARGVTEA